MAADQHRVARTDELSERQREAVRNTEVPK